MILDSIDQTQPIEIITHAGREKGVMFLKKIFVADRCYKNLDQAIAASRSDLDSGFAVLIIPHEHQYQVWISIPPQMILHNHLSQSHSSVAA
ncbi:MAG: hypothetical protein NW214_11535 [Pseudanabaenaceae cyanobacterium bins.39]|nr:hypothetical protein [Pseudanabaenaceae cyanobacterium bins.39]